MLIAVIFSLRTGTQYWRNKVLEVAKDWSPRYHFAISDEEEFQNELNAAGLAESGMEVHDTVIETFILNSAGERYCVRLRRQEVPMESG